MVARTKMLLLLIKNKVKNKGSFKFPESVLVFELGKITSNNYGKKGMKTFLINNENKKNLLLGTMKLY